MSHETERDDDGNCADETTRQWCQWCEVTHVYCDTCGEVLDNEGDYL